MHVVYTITWENDVRYLNCSQQNPSPAHWFSKHHAVKKLQLHGRVGDSSIITHHFNFIVNKKMKIENSSSCLQSSYVLLDG